MKPYLFLLTLILLSTFGLNAQKSMRAYQVFSNSNIYKAYAEKTFAMRDNNQVIVGGVYDGYYQIPGGDLSEDYSSQGYVAKVDADGKVIWERNLKCNKRTSSSYRPGLRIWDAEIHDDYSLVCTGSFSYQMNVGNILIEAGEVNYELLDGGFVFKLDENGEPQWGFSVSATTDSTSVFGYDVGVGADGTTICSFSLNGYDGIEYTLGGDTFQLEESEYQLIVRLDADGELLSHWVFPRGYFGMVLSSFAGDDEGNTYVAAKLDSGKSLLDFEAADTQTYILKIDGMGHVVWGRGLGELNYQSRPQLRFFDGYLYIVYKSNYGLTIDGEVIHTGKTALVTLKMTKDDELVASQLTSNNVNVYCSTFTLSHNGVLNLNVGIYGSKPEDAGYKVFLTREEVHFFYTPDLRLLLLMDTSLSYMGHYNLEYTGADFKDVTSTDSGEFLGIGETRGAVVGFDTLPPGNNYEMLAFYTRSFDLPVGVNHTENGRMDQSIVFPNPFHSEVDVKFMATARYPVSYEWFDITGRRVKQGSLLNAGEEAKLSLEESGGLYILKLQDSSGATSVHRLQKL